MVKIPSNGVFTTSRSDVPPVYNYYRFFLHESPTQLLHLEEIADAIATNLRATSSNIDLWQVAMNKVREYFKMEFKLRCEECGTAHYQDEISAPER
ncbi:hypothetical protein evm_005975 [Chilo suppressalis]|nr:hypothetical protein evm_005975 [Chilo suppressalis]